MWLCVVVVRDWDKIGLGWSVGGVVVSGGAMVIELSFGCGHVVLLHPIDGSANEFSP